jgi:Na+(H+)/acetate symporter ActP
VVTALTFLAFTCAAACALSILIRAIMWSGKAKTAFTIVAVVAGLACVTMFVTGYSVYQKHWNTTCHRMGGQLSGDDKHPCVKGPIEEIQVP